MMHKHRGSQDRGSSAKKKKSSKKAQDIEQAINTNTFKKVRIHQEFKLSETHRDFVRLTQEAGFKLGILDGPAGTNKTYLSVYTGLLMLNSNKIDKIIYIRSLAESADKGMGFLPGEVEDKFHPWSMPLQDKLSELLDEPDTRNIINGGFIDCIPVNYTRGLTFRSALVIVDESQNHTKQELITILTRFGHNSRYLLIGDKSQSDIKTKSGFRKIYDAFEKKNLTEHGIHTLRFDEKQIVRSEILKVMIPVLEDID